MEGSGNSASKPIAKVFEEVCEGENVGQDVPNETAIGRPHQCVSSEAEFWTIPNNASSGVELRGRYPIIVQFERVIRHQGWLAGGDCSTGDWPYDRECLCWLLLKTN